MLIILKISLAIIAGVIVLIEQFRSKEKYRPGMLVLAAFLIFGSAILTWADYQDNKKSERERTADLLLIQKMSSSLRDLCFELELNDIDSASALDISFQFEAKVYTMKSNTDLFANYSWLHFKLDSGWVWSGSDYNRYNNIMLNIDEMNNKLRFVFDNFVISELGERDLVAWEPTNIADLGQVTLSMHASPIRFEDIKRLYNSEWCPISIVRVFVNSFEPDNELFIAERNVKLPKNERKAHYAFIPKNNKSFGDSFASEFIIEPLRLRESILKSLD